MRVESSTDSKGKRDLYNQLENSCAGAVLEQDQTFIDERE